MNYTRLVTVVVASAAYLVSTAPLKAEDDFGRIETIGRLAQASQSEAGGVSPLSPPPQFEQPIGIAPKPNWQPVITPSPLVNPPVAKPGTILKPPGQQIQVSPETKPVEPHLPDNQKSNGSVTQVTPLRDVRQLTRTEVERVVSEAVRTLGSTKAYDAIVAQVESPAYAPDKAKISLTYADALSRVSAKGSEPIALEALKTLYSKAWNSGDARTQLIARSNFATIAFRAGASDQALAVYRGGYPAAQKFDDNAVRARYMFNFAHVTEESGDPSRALPLYLESYEADPRSARPALGAIKASTQTGQLDITATILKKLINHGHVQTAKTEIIGLLYKSDLVSADSFANVTDVLFDYFATARLGVGAFDELWRGQLNERKRELSGGARQRVELILAGYSPEARFPSPLELDPIEIRNIVAPWFDEPWDPKRAAEALGPASRFLTTVGEIHAAEGNREVALTRYLLGWTLDTSNVTAGLYAANLLQSFPQELDPNRVVLDRFIKILFSGKAEAYLGNDWSAIFRFHTVLGSIYWEQQKWGSSGEVRSAIFQLENALEARRRIEDPEERNVFVGRLHLMLGDAYAGVGRSRDAFASYERAAGQSYSSDRAGAAREALARIDRLDYTPTAREQENLRRVRDWLR